MAHALSSSVLPRLICPTHPSLSPRKNACRRRRLRASAEKKPGPTTGWGACADTVREQASAPARDDSLTCPLMNHKDYKRLYSKFSDRSPLTLALNLMHKTEHAVLGTVLMAPVDTIMHHSEGILPLPPRTHRQIIG